MTQHLRKLVNKRTNPSSILKRVAIVGGTHGNELSGVHMVQYFENAPEVVRRPSFETTCVLSNLEAIKQNARYVNTDMNRCFDFEYLQGAQNTKPSERIVEQKRALEMDQILGPKFSESPAADLVLDLHNTTSNCGVLLCFHKDDDFARQIAAYLKHFVDPEICTVVWPQEDPPFLPTIGRSGLTVEVGPVAHSTVRAVIYERTKKLIERALDYVELHNRYLQNKNDPAIKRIQVKLPVAERVVHIDYPRDSQGRLTAFVHPKLQDIAELRPGSTVTDGSPIFQDLAGKTIKLNTSDYPSIRPGEALYPMFVNEAAYVEKGVAFYLTRLAESSVTILADSKTSGQVASSKL